MHFSTPFSVYKWENKNQAAQRGRADLWQFGFKNNKAVEKIILQFKVDYIFLTSLQFSKQKQKEIGGYLSAYC